MPPPWFEPSWADQRLQFMTRYFFGALGVLYFNFVFDYVPTWLSRGQMNAFLLAYLLWVTALFVLAHRTPYSPRRFRVAMWADVACVSMAVLNDPFVVPLSSLVYVIIVLGNGMRFGMRCFSEALIVTFFAALITLAFRNSGSFFELTPAGIFLYIFGAIILLYAYVLMSRVEASRCSLEESSRIDPLTGLTNRSALMKAAEQMLAPVKDGHGTLVVMFADLDKFKAVNDTLGHAEGDRVLHEVAQILRSNIRQSDLAARYGGDEFVLMLRDTVLGQATDTGRRIQTALAQWSKRNHIDISVTIGLGEAPTHGTDLKSLLACVDQALYRSKSEHGASGVCPVADGDRGSPVWERARGG